jgi:enoyl-CoA hydratase/carnithine racemase
MSSHVIVTTRDRIARIELDRADKKNAITADMYQAMADGLKAAESDSNVRVVLFHGKPDCFTAGNDLKDFLERPPSGDNSPVFQFLQGISTASKPLVAAVAGPAVGIGTTMLLHCDFVYASPSARFQMPFVTLGLVPEAASSLLLPMAAGYHRAAELLLLGKPFTAEKALAAGIVTEIVPDAELLDHALEVAAGIAALPPSSLRMTKALLKARYASAVVEAMGSEGEKFRAQLGSAEAKEAMKAFFEKRKPDFSKF